MSTKNNPSKKMEDNSRLGQDQRDANAADKKIPDQNRNNQTVRDPHDNSNVVRTKSTRLDMDTTHDEDELEADQTA